MAGFILFVMILGFSATASASSAGSSHVARPSQTPGSEQTTTTTAPPVAQMPVQVAPAPSAHPSTSGLPVTGSNIVGLTAVGVVLMAGGGLVLMARRRRWS